MLFTHLIELLSLLLFVFIALMIFVGWGSFIRNAIGIPSSNQFRLSNAWIGIVGAMTFAETCHLWAPIDWKLSLVFLIIGALGLISSNKANAVYQAWQLKHPRNINLFVIFVACYLLACWASLAMTKPTIYDGGLYHFQAIRWLNEFPIILGLGNLSGRLAFNQSYFEYLALLNFSPWFGKGYAMGGLLLMALGSITLLEARFHKIKGGWWINLWILIAFISISKALSSPSPDVAVVLIQCSTFIFLLKMYTCRKSIDSSDTIYSAVMVFFLSCLLVTIKFSAMIFALASIALALPTIAKTRDQYRKLYFCSLLMGVYCIALHLFRGILLSGLPLYPSTLGSIPRLDWSVPRDQAQEMANWIYGWARDSSKPPSEVLGSWAWLPLWFNQLLQERWRYIHGALMLISFNIIALLTTKPIGEEKKIFTLYTPFIASIVFWFLTAPDWRFLGALPQLLIALSGYICIRCCINNPIYLYSQKLPTYFASSFVSLIALILMTKTVDFKTLPLSGWQALPTVQVVPQATASGLMILIPVEGDQCWDSALPCAPMFNRNLRLRDQGKDTQNLQSGFSIQR
jgi:hypothetical protein